MYSKVPLLLFALLISHISYSQQSRHLLNGSQNPKIQQQIAEIKTKSADTTNIYSAMPSGPLPNLAEDSLVQHFPYPIIFIHGLAAASDSWTIFSTYAMEQGWSYGGQLLFNLNSDDDLDFSDITSPELSDVSDFNTEVSAADFYLINFNCDLDGTAYSGNKRNPTQSNQAAIVKQGLAIGQAIKHVLEATEKNKVILFGHSMGGLAARQYLQNSDLWPNDDQHHVAKFITTGTPHGGSNTSGSILSQIFRVDEGSDAVRDLRRTYFYSRDPGVFLYGGLEASSVMNDRLFGFQNYDVNCNGVTGDTIIGLNQKDLSNDLDFTCIISDFSLGSDGVVGIEKAQLKTYYDILAETFEINAFHTSMPDRIKTDFEGIDEPDFYNLAYEIATNTNYHGYTTLQASDAFYKEMDFDDFVFTTVEDGWLSVKVGNVDSIPFGISILRDPDYDYLFDETFIGDSIQTEVIRLSAGTYYLELYAQGSASSWEHPYNFRLDWSPDHPTATTEVEENFQLKVWPNPVNDYVYLKLEMEDGFNGSFILTNELGQQLYQKPFAGRTINEQIDTKDLPAGVYFLTIATSDVSKTIKLIKKGD